MRRGALRIQRAVLGAVIANGVGAYGLAILIAALPFSFLLRLLQQLPAALILSHRRWPLPVNSLITVAVTAASTWFFDHAFSGTHTPWEVLFELAIVSAIYGFGLVLLLRQFCGAYDEFVITVGVGGLFLQKTSYSNILSADQIRTGGGETRLQLDTAHARRIRLDLPTAQVDRFYAHIREKR